MTINNMIVDISHWCSKVVFHREDFYNISEFTQQDGKMLVCGKHDRPITYAFCGDLH